MTPARPPHSVQPAPRPDPARYWGAAVPIMGAVLSAGGVIFLWWAFVTTPTGQQLDDAAALGASFGRETLEPFLLPVLTIVSIPFVAAALIAAVTFAILQRRRSIAIGAVVLLGGANVTTQLLKEVLPRPNLDVTYVLGNSLPSGHTTVAASVAATALLIAPHRVRGVVAVAGAGYAVLTGLGTLVGGWHRPSDVVAAYLVVAAWYFLVEASRQVRSATALPRGYRAAPPVNAAAVLGGTGLLSAVSSAAIGAWVLAQLPDSSTAIADLGGGPTTLAYAGGCLAVVGAACLLMGSMLVMRPYQRD
ncbi:phosphatase PAP2 family protein [Ruania halotolerans]|uniref:phosphatase PAP2 family protein n=1 Tax=Ruania halotolerans TaxID=2897773 RepID=UPI001E3D2E3F|nr:phosphatase PAP2 family protein [Ruania halotolerans]UFU07145.1 phosphatase PAP2 family protein [Ruania halotolerans]